MGTTDSATLIKTQEDVLCLLFIYCAHLDHDFSESEEELIVNTYGYERYSSIVTVFEECPENELLQLVLEQVKVYFPTKASIAELNSQLNTIFSIDGNICSFEKSFKQLLNDHLS